ncbi:MAG TPA: DUF3109 family protein [Niabella sp.]|nr:DUF3109 family protein [Niabella sp.]HOZ97971.1 DUF3109 family protein [Niabella sp.]HQW14144.1 DUF3109 family protein [Niabella sp.]HQX19543.1 DUF3109 family protein [Niabella sp.]HQX40022.1 DUF3109 family protein [Niabella sp.]
MIIIENKIISDDIAEAQFVCDLSKCKGGCCEEGDAGAPLTEAELKEVENHFEIIKSYMTEDAIKEVEQSGFYSFSEEFGWVTPTLASDNEICVYAFREKNGLIKCAFEQAYNEGKIFWKKPISCHLYPIIAYKGVHGDYERLNYEPREKLCSPGCALGEKLKVPVHAFLKEPLIRKYGEAFYEALDQAVAMHKQEK